MPKGWVWKRRCGGHVQFFATPWTVPCQDPLSMGCFRQEYWSGKCHFLLQGIFPTQGLNLRLLYRQADSLPLSHQGSPKEKMVSFKLYTEPYHFIYFLIGKKWICLERNTLHRQWVGPYHCILTRWSLKFSRNKQHKKRQIIFLKEWQLWKLLTL